MSTNGPSQDWIRFFVRFFFGALLGALAGLFLWAWLLSGAALGWLAIPAMALVIGVMAGLLGDHYWESFREQSWWNPLNWF